MTGNKTTHKLTATKREDVDSANSLRSSGFVPLELYGKNEKNVHLKAKLTDFTKIFSSAGESSLIDLVIDKDDTGKILIKATQIDPIKDTIIHADLYKINMKEKITTEIPLAFTGTALAVKEHGGILVKQVDSVHVQCLPGDLVHEILVDLSSLVSFDESILIKDLKLPEGIEVLNDDTVLVANVAEPRKIEEIEVPVEEGEEGEVAEGEEGEAKEGEAKPEGEAKEGEAKPEEKKSE